MAFGFERTITMDATLVPSNQVNIPVLVSGTYAYLATVANGGDVQNASGFDVGFYADAALTAKLAWETERYVATTGEVVYWVKVPALSSSVDTVIYLAYGNSGITTDQSNPTGVWDADFKAVYHLPDGTTLSALDSTGQHPGTNANVTASAGQIDGAGSFNGTTASIDLGSTGFTFGTGDYTLEAWFNTASAAYQMILGKDVSGNRQFVFEVNGITAGKLECYDINTGITANAASVSYTGSVWQKGVGVRDGSVMRIYLNGAAGTPGVTTSNYTVASPLYIGRREFAGFEQWFAGSLDELRISTVARSANWIATTYNSESDPATFYAVGSAVTPPTVRGGYGFILG